MHIIRFAMFLIDFVFVYQQIELAHSLTRWNLIPSNTVIRKCNIMFACNILHTLECRLEGPQSKIYYL